MSTVVRASSRGEILELIRRGDLPTRRYLAERTGLSRSVIAQAVSELIAEGLVAERVVVRSTGGPSRGRPTSVLRTTAQDGWVGAIDGVAFSGARGVGGEMGHVQVDPGGELCRCGHRGCLETVVSPSRIRNRLAATARGRRADPAPIGAGPDDADEADDAEGYVLTADNRSVFVEIGHAIGGVIANLCNFLDPGAVVIGGKIGAVGEPVLVGVRQAFDEFGQVSTLRDVVLARSQLGTRSELVGAVDRAVDVVWRSARTPA